MFGIALLLGPVAFRDFEIPSAINFGGAQRLAVHRLSDGTRIIDALGRDDADITFSGTFTGANATLRARLLDELRVAGTPLPLTWDVFFYTILISRFQADYQQNAWIPYRLSCTVLRDEASALIEAAVSLGGDVLADAGTALAQAAPAGVDLTQAQMALAAPQATVRGTSAYTAAQAAVGTALGSLGGALGQAEAALPGATAFAPGAASSGASALTAALTSAQQLGALTTARGYLARAGVNLQNAST